MDCACCWTVFSWAAGSAPVLVIFSMALSNVAITCSQVGNGGGAWAVLSCSPKTASFLSPCSVWSCQAEETDGRSVDDCHHCTWVSGWLRNSTNFQALLRF